MIIRTSDVATILEAQFEGDKFKLVHAQPTGEILKDCYEQRNENDPNQFNMNEFEKIASIPAIEFHKHPEFMHDSDTIVKWLKTDEGKPYRTSRRRI